MAGNARPMTVGEMVGILSKLPENAAVVVMVNAHYSSVTISGFHGMDKDYARQPIAVFCEDCEGRQNDGEAIDRR